MKKTIRDYDLNNKKVIIRVDFNVPIEDGAITDDNRIREALDTINYAVNNNAKVILMSHLGRIKDKADLMKNNMKPVSERLSELLKKEVIFIDKTRGKELENAINKMNGGEVLLMQNTRYEDVDNEKESKNDSELGKYWASLGDIYINDAFGTAHRSHASNVGIAKYLPSGIGFLMEKEIKNIREVIDNPIRPFTVIMGGAKVSDKIKLIENMVDKADYIILGGGLANTFLKALGCNVGKSLVDLDSLEFCKKMLESYSKKIILPLDVVVGYEMNDKTDINTRVVTSINNNEMCFDIGPKSIEIFKKIIDKSETVMWNGPVGVFEIDKFSTGTKSLLESLVGKITIIGGGDTASAAINLGYKGKFTHISTGGGASLEMMEGLSLPGIECIDEQK